MLSHLQACGAPLVCMFFFPRLSLQCLELADIIASENHKLHEVFRKDELQKFLSLLEKSALAMLDERQLELGYPL